MSDLASFIKANYLDFTVSTGEQLTTVIPLIRVFSLPYKRLFLKHKYALQHYKESEQPEVIKKLLFLINEASFDESLLSFLTDLCIKLIKEAIIKQEHGRKLIEFYFVASHCCFRESNKVMSKPYFEQYLRLIVLTHNQPCFNLFQSVKTSFQLEAKLSLLRSEHLLNLLSFSNSTELLSSLIKWNYNQSMHATMINQLASHFFNHKTEELIFTIQQQIELLKGIKSAEQADPSQLMNGLEIVSGFHLAYPITLPNEDFIIEFSFVKHQVGPEAKDVKQCIISFTNEKNEPLLFFFVMNQALYIDYYKETALLHQIEYGKVVHVSLAQTVPGFISFGYYQAMVTINKGSSIKKMSLSDYLKGSVYFRIDGFKGQLGKVILFKQKKPFDEEGVELLIDPLVLLYQHQQKKPFNLVHTAEPNVLVRNSKDHCKGDFDKPFERISFKDSFNDNEGIAYLLLVMSFLQSTIKHATKRDEPYDSASVYKCIKLLLEFVFDMYKDSIDSWKEPLFTFFYSVNLLIDQVVGKQRLPIDLIELFFDQLHSVNNQNLKSNLFMIVINPTNIAIEHTGILIKLWPSFNEKPDKYTTIFMLQSLIYFYQQEDTPKKGIGNILSKILVKSRGDIKVFYLDKVLLLSHTKHLYKLLKICYLALPQSSKEPLGTFAIYTRLCTLYEEHSDLKDKYAVLLQALIVRLVDELFIRHELKTSKGFIQSNEVNSRVNESSNYSQNNVLLNKIDMIIDKAQISLHSLRSIFLMVFQLTGQSSQSSQIANFAFIKGKTEPKSLNYFNFNSRYIIPNVFRVINQLKPRTPEYDEYCTVLHGFLNEILNKIGENNQKSMDIFESQKILGDIYMNIIQSKALPQEEIIKDFTLMIERTFTLHLNPFYFIFVYRLTGFDQQALLIKPIISKMISFKYNNTAILLSNSKNLLLLLYKLLFHSSIDKKSVLDFIIAYVKNNNCLPLIYTRLLYEVIRPHQKQFLIEMLIEMVVEFYLLNNEVECTLLRTMLLFADESNKIHSIFFYLDIWTNDKATDKSKANWAFIKEIVDTEERIRDISGVRNSYVLLNYFALRICALTQRDAIAQSKLLATFLNELLRIICFDLNKLNEISKMKKKNQLKIQVKVNDLLYRKFKSKMKSIFKVNQSVSVEEMKQIYTELISQSMNTASVLSYDTCDSTVVEPANNINNKSELSVSETYSVNRNSIETNSTVFIDLRHEEKQLNRWFKLIKAKGIKLIHKAKTELMKSSLALFFTKHFFFNEQFDSVIRDSFNTFTHHANTERLESLPYPSKLRNYTTDNFTKPFLSINRKAFNGSEFLVAHSYLNANSIDTSIINDYTKYPIKFSNRFRLDCELIKLDGVYYSVLYKYKKVLIIVAKKHNEQISIDKKYPLSSISYIFKPKQVIIALAEIKEAIIRRFLFQPQAVELFLSNGRSYLLNFFSKEAMDSFFQLLDRIQIKNKYSYQLITNSRTAFISRKYAAKWKSELLSTFDYILLLNKFAGRSYNDLNQYPIFPWVLLDYENFSSRQLRRFEYPISIQSEERKAIALATYDNVSNCFDDYFQIPSHYHSHYSTNAIVYYFLNRVEPFTKLNIQFQSERLDHPNRQFHSLHRTLKSIEHTNGNRELLPELFYLPEMLLNLNYVFYGLIDGEDLISNVALPNDCANEEELLFSHRSILNLPEVGMTIHKWFDNVFGANQLVQKKESLNVFPGHTYEQIINEKNLLKEDIEKVKAFIINLGQTPMQLLTTPHPARDAFIKQSTVNLPQAVINEAQPLENLLSPENILSHLNTCRYIETDMNDVKCVTFSSKSVIILSSKRVKVFNKKSSKVEASIQLDDSFLFMNSHCLIHLNDCAHFVCGNFYDKTLKVFQKDKHSPIHTEATGSFVMTLCVGGCDEKETTFYSGSSKGIIAKWIFISEGKSQLIREHTVVAHRGPVAAIVFSEYLSALISSGDDCFIFIRNVFSYELLACIDVGYIAKDILLFDSITIFAFGVKASGFTLNGVRFTEVNKEYSNPQVIGAKLFLTSAKQNLIQLSPFDLSKEISKSALIGKEEDQLVHMHLNEEDKVIDCFLTNKGIKRISLIQKGFDIKMNPAIENYFFYLDF